MTFEGDESPDTETIAYTNMTMLCPNKECDQYAGEDLTNPRIIIDVVKNRVN